MTPSAVKRLFCLSVAAGLLLSRSTATTVEPPEFDRLVELSPQVVRATVTAISAEWRSSPENPDQRVIKSRITLEVREAIKGAAPRVMVIEALGGRVGDEELRIEGAPELKVGQESILFLNGIERAYTPLTGLMHGYYPVRRDKRTGVDRVLRSNGKPLYSEQDVALPLAASSFLLAHNPHAPGMTAEQFATKIRGSAAAAALRAKQR
jgi:hypothetical protein